MINDFCGKLIKYEYEAEKAEKDIKSIKPYPRPKKDKNNTLQLFNEAKSSANAKSSVIKTFRMGPDKHFSQKRMEDLKQISIKDLKVNEIHYGRYLECRTITEPYYSTSMNVIIQDDEGQFIQNNEGQVENVSIYNYTKSFEIEPKLILPVNSYIRIKEPYLKILPSNNKEFHIQIESPSDIEFFKEDLVISTMGYDDLNLLANKYFVNKNYHLAEQVYTKALKHSEEAKVLNNRAAAYLHLEKYNLAFEDCVKSIEFGPSEKAYFRMGKAAYHMRQFEKSKECFLKCLQINPKNCDARNELSKVKDRLNEAKTGDYNVKELIEECRNGTLRLDVADYMSNDIHIAAATGKGKGIFSKRDIKQGTLIIASKAASIVYARECKFLQHHAVNFYTKKVELYTSCQNAANLIYKARHDPHLTKEIYKLYPGDKINRNQFIDSSIIDPSRIEAILSYNSTKSLPLDFTSNFEPEENDLENNIGIWITPAYLNHSCLPNTRRIHFNDFVMIYASLDIKKGDEITRAYAPTFYSYEDRVNFLSQYGIKCDCKLCKLDENDSNLKHRENYINENKIQIKQLSDTNCKDVKICEAFLQKVKQSYKNRDELQFSLIVPLMCMAKFYLNAGKTEKSALVYMELFELCKDYVEEMALYGLVEAINCHIILFDTESAKACFKIAKDYCLGHEDFFMHLCDAKIIDFENIRQTLVEFI